MILPTFLIFRTSHSRTSLISPTSFGYFISSGKTVASTSIPFALIILRSISTLYVFLSNSLKKSNPNRSLIFVSVLRSRISSVTNFSYPQKAYMYRFSNTSWTISSSDRPVLCFKSSNPIASCASVPGRPTSEIRLICHQMEKVREIKVGFYGLYDDT